VASSTLGPSPGSPPLWPSYAKRRLEAANFPPPSEQVEIAPKGDLGFEEAPTLTFAGGASNGEGYTTKAGCLHVISLVDGGRNLPVYEID
jgi:hypothetical protein